MEIFLLSIALIGLAFIGIAIKIISKKDGEFSGTCASQSPFLNNSNEPCGVCGKIPIDSECANEAN
ncbi:MAG: membrane or secreted protein [Bacteroidota bacterium]|nr:membrane or secreted protein [Bacteroidota bacterium]